MKWIYTFNEDDTLHSMENISDFQIGDAVLVYSRTYLGTYTHLGEYGKEIFHISKKFAAEGYPGNSNGNIKRFHGWRGTTNDFNIYAYGVYTIKDVIHENGKIKITLNKTDIKKDKD